MGVRANGLRERYQGGKNDVSARDLDCSEEEHSVDATNIFMVEASPNRYIAIVYLYRYTGQIYGTLTQAHTFSRQGVTCLCVVNAFYLQNTGGLSK